MKECPICKKGKRIIVDDILYELGTKKLLLKGERCTFCKEEFFGDAEHEKLYKLRQEQNVWEGSIKLHRKLSRSGRGTVLRIPTDIEQTMHLKGTESVIISQVGKRKLLIEIT